MNNRLSFFEHKGSKILWCDYSKSGEEQMISLLEQAVDLGKTAGAELNILSDFKSTPKRIKICPLILSFMIAPPRTILFTLSGYLSAISRIRASFFKKTQILAIKKLTIVEKI